MYIVKIFKTIWADDPPDPNVHPDDVTFYPEYIRMGHALKIPFAPYPGIRITNQTEKGSFNSGEIIEVTWQAKDSTFICLVEDEAPFSDGHQSYEFDWLVDEALKDGWKKIK